MAEEKEDNTFQSTANDAWSKNWLVPVLLLMLRKWNSYGYQLMEKMTAFGMKTAEKDYALVLDYLAKSFPPDDVPRLNVNTATAIQLESGLSVRRSQAKAIIEWREKNGEFKSLDDLKKVPGIDADKIEEKKDRITFQ